MSIDFYFSVRRTFAWHIWYAQIEREGEGKFRIPIEWERERVKTLSVAKIKAVLSRTWIMGSREQLVAAGKFSIATYEWFSVGVFSAHISFATCKRKCMLINPVFYFFFFISIANWLRVTLYHVELKSSRHLKVDVKLRVLLNFPNGCSSLWLR